MRENPKILYDDSSLLVIDKPAGWVVHEGAGETGETIVDWYVRNYPEVMDHMWPDLMRVGIVHRLDKDTSGVMLLAKTPAMLEALQAQFKERSTKKLYKALVYGEPKEKEGVVETFIGRHPKRRQEQAVLPIQVGERARREAITHYKIEDIYFYKQETICLLDFEPKTGRMHQLRVHAKYLGCPILGDPVYNIKPSKRLSKELGVERQLLHAYQLSFEHPVRKEMKTITCELAGDITKTIYSINK